MYILVPFIFFIWGGLILAYFQFGFQPEWLASILDIASASDSAVNAFMLSTRGGLIIIGVGVLSLIFCIFALLQPPSADESPSRPRNMAPRRDFHHEPEKKERDPLSFGALFDELSQTSSSEPEYLQDSNGKSVRITGRGSDVVYLENGDVVYTTDGQDYYTTDDHKYHDYE